MSSCILDESILLQYKVLSIGSQQHDRRTCGTLGKIDVQRTTWSLGISGFFGTPRPEGTNDRFYELFSQLRGVTDSDRQKEILGHIARDLFSAEIDFLPVLLAAPCDGDQCMGTVRFANTLKAQYSMGIPTVLFVSDDAEWQETCHLCESEMILTREQARILGSEMEEAYKRLKDDM